MQAVAAVKDATHSAPGSISHRLAFGDANASTDARMYGLDVWLKPKTVENILYNEHRISGERLGLPIARTRRRASRTGAV